MSSIAVICPVLGRPQNARPLVESFEASRADAQMVFVCSPGDDAEIDACLQTLHPDRDVRVEFASWPSGPGDYAMKTQLGYDLTVEPYVLCGADDLRFHPGWDIALLAIAEEYDVGVIGTADLGNGAVIAGKHSTHPLVARAYIDSYGGAYGEPGQVFHAGYSHNFVDVELVELAKRRGCYAHCHDAVVEHNHPLWRKAEMDATYRKGSADVRADRELFERRQRLWAAEAGLSAKGKVA